MYLVDTDVISDAREGAKDNLGVQDFFRNAVQSDTGQTTIIVDYV